MNLDHTTDSTHKELYAFLNGTHLPTFVKDAEWQDREEVDKLAHDAFADSYNKAFPINTPADTFLSNVYFVNKKAALAKRWGKTYVADVAEKIQKAAEVFNIKTDVETYNNKAMEKQSKDYSQKYIFESDFADQKINLFPYKTAQDFKTAAHYFATNTSRYPFEWRRDIANSFVKAAQEMGVDELPETVCKYAGLYFPHLTNTKEELNRRANKLADVDRKKKYAELIESINPESSIEDYFKVAAEAHNLEFEEGLYQTKRAEVLGDIVENVFSLSVEKVAEMLDVVEMAGETYPIETLSKISAEIYKEAFGIDINPSDRGQLRDVLPTMPLSDVSLFRELSGIRGI